MSGLIQFTGTATTNYGGLVISRPFDVVAQTVVEAEIEAMRFTGIGSVLRAAGYDVEFGDDGSEEIAEVDAVVDPDKVNPTAKVRGDRTLALYSELFDDGMPTGTDDADDRSTVLSDMLADLIHAHGEDGFQAAYNHAQDHFWAEAHEAHLIAAEAAL